jgi:hypothetical protein
LHFGPFASHRLRDLGEEGGAPVHEVQVSSARGPVSASIVPRRQEQQSASGNATTLSHLKLRTAIELLEPILQRIRMGVL